MEAEKPFQDTLHLLRQGQVVTPSPQIGDKIKMPDEHFAISAFKSPVQVNIDGKLSKLKEAHIVIHRCLGKIVTAVDFDEHSVQIVNKEDKLHE